MWEERFFATMVTSQTREMAMATAKKAVAPKVSAKRAAPVKRAAAPVVQPRHDRVDWRSLYLYAVCLITLLVVLFSTVALINAIMNAVFPDPGYIDIYAKPENAPSADLLAQQEENNQIQALKRIFTSFTTIAIAAPLYLYHWRTARPFAGRRPSRRCRDSHQCRNLRSPRTRRHRPDPSRRDARKRPRRRGCR